jgi:hypothetical protein
LSTSSPCSMPFHLLNGASPILCRMTSRPSRATPYVSQSLIPLVRWASLLSLCLMSCMSF